MLFQYKLSDKHTRTLVRFENTETRYHRTPSIVWSSVELKNRRDQCLSLRISSKEKFEQKNHCLKLRRPNRSVTLKFIPTWPDLPEIIIHISKLWNVAQKIEFAATRKCSRIKCFLFLPCSCLNYLRSQNQHILGQWSLVDSSKIEASPTSCPLWQHCFAFR